MKSNAAMAFKTTDKTTAYITTKNRSAESIITASSTSSLVNNSTRLFDFFGLPRELRDKIYEQPVLMDHWLVPTYLEHDIHIEAVKLRMSLLLVNRQFRDEYTERCEDQQALFLHDAFTSLEDASILAEFDMLRSWVLGICYFESAREPDDRNNVSSNLEPYCGRKKDCDEDSEVWRVSRSTNVSTGNGADEEDVEGNTGTGDSRSDRKSGSDAIKRVRQWLLLV
jgi:hypothetical protein